MDTLSAFANGEANRNKELMVFDWDKAAQLIRENKPETVSAGLRGDWEWTGGTIWENGEPDMESYTYLSSTWAVPEIDLDGEIIECFKMQSETNEWDSRTKWPDNTANEARGV